MSTANPGDAGATMGSETAIDVDALDLGEAREQLRVLRRRVAVYEEFDDVIADNVRRAKEMMEAAAGLGSLPGGQTPEVRDRINEELAALEGDAARLTGEVAAFAERVTFLRSLLTGDTATPRDITGVPEHDPAPLSVAAPAPGPREVELIAQGVNDPRVALSLQRFLRDSPGVEEVELREFAEGMLRLRLTAGLAFEPGSLSHWEGASDLTVTTASNRVVEVSLR